MTNSARYRAIPLRVIVAAGEAAADRARGCARA